MCPGHDSCVAATGDHNAALSGTVPHAELPPIDSLELDELLPGGSSCSRLSGCFVDAWSLESPPFGAVASGDAGLTSSADSLLCSLIDGGGGSVNVGLDLGAFTFTGALSPVFHEVPASPPAVPPGDIDIGNLDFSIIGLEAPQMAKQLGPSVGFESLPPPTDTGSWQLPPSPE